MELLVAAVGAPERSVTGRAVDGSQKHQSLHFSMQ